MHVNEYDGKETPYFDSSNYSLEGICAIAEKNVSITNEEIKK